jgi:hypothetical protein
MDEELQETDGLRMRFDSEWQEREAFQKMYGEPYCSWLWEMLSAIDKVENRAWLGREAQAHVKEKFRQLMHEHVPSTRKAVEQVEAEWNAAEAKRNEARAAYDEVLRQRERDELAAIERRAVREFEKQRQMAIDDEKKWEEIRQKAAQEERERDMRRTAEDARRQAERYA